MADPNHEFLSCVLAGKYFAHFGMDAFPETKEFPKTGDRVQGKRISYHVRPGCHYLGREDWNVYMAFEKMGEK